MNDFTFLNLSLFFCKMGANPPLTQGNEKPHPKLVAILGPIQVGMVGQWELWWDSGNDGGPGSCQGKGLNWALKDERAGELVPKPNLLVACCPAPG